MPTSIDPLVRLLDVIGFVDVILPFIVVFTMVYALLEKTMVLGRERGHARHKLNAMVGLIAGLLVVGSTTLLGVTTMIVQYLGLLAIVIVAFALVLGLFGVEHLPQSKFWNTVFFVLFMLMSIAVLRRFGLNEAVIGIFMVFFIVLFIILFWLSEAIPAQQHAGHHAGQARSAAPTRRAAAQASPQLAQQRAVPPAAAALRPQVQRPEGTDIFGGEPETELSFEEEEPA